MGHSTRKTYGRKTAKRRWGSLDEIDYRIKVGSQAWKALPRRIRQLTAWRRMHMLPGGEHAHMPVRMFGTRAGVRPSSNLPLARGKASKIAYIKHRGG